MTTVAKITRREIISHAKDEGWEPELVKRHLKRIEDQVRMELEPKMLINLALVRVLNNLVE